MAKQSTSEKEYYVWDRITKEGQYVIAQSAQEACEKCGLMIGNCQVKEVVTLHRGMQVV